MSSSTVRIPPTKKDFTFPNTDERIEIFTYKNGDGSFKNAECIFYLIRQVFDRFTECVQALPSIDKTKRYNLKFTSINEGHLSEVPVGSDGKLLFDQEHDVYSLSLNDVMTLKDVIVEGVTSIIELFSGYYTPRAPNAMSSEPIRNGDLADLLRFSNGAKIRFLEEILNLYLALNGQTYFDVISNIVMVGSYTLSSIFSTTGLYFAMYKKLRGRTLLEGASRRTFKDLGLGMVRGEIHMSGGLIVFHARQFRIKPARQPRVLDISQFERIVLENDTSSRDTSVSRASSLSGNVSSEADNYALIQNRRLLKYKGEEKMLDIHQRFADLVGTEEQLHKLRNIPANSVHGLRMMLDYLSQGVFRSMCDEIRSLISTKREVELIGVLKNIEGYEKNDVLRLLSQYALVFFAMCDTAEMNKNDKTILERILEASDPIDVISECIINLQDLTA